MLKLVKLGYGDEGKLKDMMEEWSSLGEVIVPFSIRRVDYHDFDAYLRGFEEETQEMPGFVLSTTYFCLDTDKDIFVGAVNIRHYLNEALLQNGGHIGDGIRPSERRKGYATQMIALALEKCREMGMDRVLMVCKKSNVGSAKSIIKNHGVLEDEIVVDGKAEQRYWIEL